METYLRSYVDPTLTNPFLDISFALAPGLEVHIPAPAIRRVGPLKVRYLAGTVQIFFRRRDSVFALFFWYALLAEIDYVELPYASPALWECNWRLWVDAVETWAPEDPRFPSQYNRAWAQAWARAERRQARDSSLIGLGNCRPPAFTSDPAFGSHRREIEHFHTHLAWLRAQPDTVSTLTVVYSAPQAGKVENEVFAANRRTVWVVVDAYTLTEDAIEQECARWAAEAADQIPALDDVV